jgi:peptidoglycan-N-acetylmuramic acid deacetylase
LAYVDWDEKKQPTREEAMEKLTQRIHPGAIILLHSTSSTNGDILDDIIIEWKNMGYTFGELNELNK